MAIMKTDIQKQLQEKYDFYQDEKQFYFSGDDYVSLVKEFGITAAGIYLGLVIAEMNDKPFKEIDFYKGIDPNLESQDLSAAKQAYIDLTAAEKIVWKDGNLRSNGVRILKGIVDENGEVKK